MSTDIDIDNRHVIPGLVRARASNAAVSESLDRCGVADSKQKLLQAIQDGMAASERAMLAFIEAQEEVMKRR